MDVPSFTDSLTKPEPPEGLSLALQSLWWDAKGDWDKAHEYAQERDDRNGARVHAYLHRKEGDLSNAGYWYRRAGTSPYAGSLAEEWETLVRSLLRPTEPR